MAIKAVSHEFCSDAWLAEAREILAELVTAAGPALDGIRFTGCEIFTDPPAHLALGGVSRTYWTFVIADGASAVTRELSQEADFQVEKDYHEALPNARKLHQKDPALHPAAASPHIPQALSKLFFDFHNRLAVLTS